MEGEIILRRRESGQSWSLTSPAEGDRAPAIQAAVKGFIRVSSCTNSSRCRIKLPSRLVNQQNGGRRRHEEDRPLPYSPGRQPGFPERQSGPSACLSKRPVILHHKGTGIRHDSPRLARIPVVIWTQLGHDNSEVCALFNINGYVRKWEGPAALREVLVTTPSGVQPRMTARVVPIGLNYVLSPFARVRRSREGRACGMFIARVFSLRSCSRACPPCRGSVRFRVLRCASGRSVLAGQRPWNRARVAILWSRARIAESYNPGIRCVAWVIGDQALQE